MRISLPDRRPLFIVFEGVDGAGTTTQCNLLAGHLRGLGHTVVQTREPGGTEIGERIRSLLLDAALPGMDDVTELLLYGASRRQHVRQVIRPALERGEPVICDRYAHSTTVYQGAARGVDSNMVAAINRFSTDGLSADLTIYLDLEISEAEARRAQRPSPLGADRIERAGSDFQEKVRSAYLKLVRGEREACVLIDASPPEAMVARSVLNSLSERFRHFPFQ